MPINELDPPRGMESIRESRISPLEPLSENEISIRTQDRGNCRVLFLSGNHTVRNAVRLREKVEEALSAGFTRLVVDLSECTYMDSAGLGVLVSSRFHCTKCNANMVICTIPPPLFRSFHLAKVDKIIPTLDTLEEAVTSFGEESSDPVNTEA